MKTSLRRLREFSSHRHGHGQAHADAKDKRDLRPHVQLDELAKASQDMKDMRECYDSLLLAAAATANSAFEFSESLRDMGACLLDKTALTDDDESGKVLVMLGKVQLGLQKLVDKYRTHLFQTITSPSESLLNELRTVEEMKRQCDEKRDVYEYMMQNQKEKGRSKTVKGENFSMQQIKAAQDEYEEEATLFIFRLKSLKQGQSRSLLTQAARHHAAQLSFFKKALKSLESVEPRVKLVTEHQHIDYNFSGLEDEEEEDEHGDGADDNARVDGELSFDYGQTDQEKDVSAIRDSLEENLLSLSFPFRGEIRAGSQSAPLSSGDNKSNPSEKLLPSRPSSGKKFHTYVLPTPDNPKHSISARSGSSVTHPSRTSISGNTVDLYNPFPLPHKNVDKISGDEKVSGSAVANLPSVPKESNTSTTSAKLPPPLSNSLLFARADTFTASDPKKLKRHAFSGPLTSLPTSSKTVPVEHPKLFSEPIPRKPLPQPPATSPSASPTFVSSPRISELHELPRPPNSSTFQFSGHSGLLGHSAPLGGVRIPPDPYKSATSNLASPLPKPPSAIARSFSIPSSRSSNPEITGDALSPPLTPLSLFNARKSSAHSETVVQDDHIKGAER